MTIANAIFELATLRDVLLIPARLRRMGFFEEQFAQHFCKLMTTISDESCQIRFPNVVKQNKSAFKKSARLFYQRETIGPIYENSGMEPRIYFCLLLLFERLKVCGAFDAGSNNELYIKDMNPEIRYPTLERQADYFARLVDARNILSNQAFTSFLDGRRLQGIETQIAASIKIWRDCIEIKKAQMAQGLERKRQDSERAERQTQIMKLRNLNHEKIEQAKAIAFGSIQELSNLHSRNFSEADLELVNLWLEGQLKKKDTARNQDIERFSGWIRKNCVQGRSGELIAIEWLNAIAREKQAAPVVDISIKQLDSPDPEIEDWAHYDLRVPKDIDGAEPILIDVKTSGPKMGAYKQKSSKPRADLVGKIQILHVARNAKAFTVVGIIDAQRLKRVAEKLYAWGNDWYATSKTVGEYANLLSCGAQSTRFPREFSVLPAWAEPKALLARREKLKLIISEIRILQSQMNELEEGSKKYSVPASLLIAANVPIEDTSEIIEASISKSMAQLVDQGNPSNKIGPLEILLATQKWISEVTSKGEVTTMQMEKQLWDAQRFLIPRYEEMPAGNRHMPLGIWDGTGIIAEFFDIMRKLCKALPSLIFPKGTGFQIDRFGTISLTMPAERPIRLLAHCGECGFYPLKYGDRVCDVCSYIVCKSSSCGCCRRDCDGRKIRDSESLKLMMNLKEGFQRKGLTQYLVAKSLGITISRARDLLACKLGSFDLSELIKMSEKLDP